MKIGIIGAGKVGISIGYILKKRGIDLIGVSDISEASINTAKKYLGDDIFYTFDSVDVVEASDIVAVTTQDRAIKDVAVEIAGRMECLENKLFFHTSGVHPATLLSPLDIKGALLGALHPLQTFPDIDSAINVLPDTYIFIEGNEESIGTLSEIGNALGSSVVKIKGDQKIIYHLSAVIVCNLLCALLYAGEDIMDKIGIGLEPFIPIIKATLNNIEKKGPLMSLTGPIIRGDVETVLSHFDAMKDMELYRRVYKSLSLVALDMAKKQGNLGEAIIERLNRILE